MRTPMVKRIGLFSGVEIQGAVLVDAVTGESQYHEEVPNRVDTLYVPVLIMQQYDYYDTLVHGCIKPVSRPSSIAAEVLAPARSVGGLDVKMLAGCRFPAHMKMGG